MRVLLTGASSFTGMWIAEHLSSEGHEVVATMTRATPEAYDGVRRQRVERVASAAAQVVFGCRLGDDRFLGTLASSPAWDALCHHAADVTDYRSASFDTLRAAHRNTHRARDVLDRLAGQGARVVLTGSVFEGNEGCGSDDLPHLSAYGLSKSITAQIWAYEAKRRGVPCDRFVIANPFGPFEEPRFTAYLMRQWLAGEPAGVRTPDYVRDNIHVEHLARAYGRFLASGTSAASRSTTPSGYIESQGRFASRVAEAMRPRIDRPCELEHAVQEAFDEPRIRAGLHPVGSFIDAAQEVAAWDAFAAYYLEAHARGAL